MKSMATQFQTQRSPARTQGGGSSVPATAGLLQRKCACGAAPGLSGECAECQGNFLQRAGSPSTISQPGDALEREADRIADAVMSGGRAELASSGGEPILQRQTPGETKKPDVKYPPEPGPSEEEKYKEAAKKIAEALRKTQAGKELEEQASKLGEKFLDSVEGKVITGTAIASAVAAAVATNADLPDLPIPDIPLDFIKPGLKAKLTWQGPARDPQECFPYPDKQRRHKRRRHLQTQRRQRRQTRRNARRPHVDHSTRRIGKKIRSVGAGQTARGNGAASGRAREVSRRLEEPGRPEAGCRVLGRILEIEDARPAQSLGAAPGRRRSAERKKGR